MLDCEDWCERSCGGMRQRGYQFVEGFLCPISSVKGHVPRVLTLVTSLASSLPGDLGPGVFITPLTSPLHPPNTALPKKENKTPPSLQPSHSSAWLHVLIGCISLHWCMTTHLLICALAWNILRSTQVYLNPSPQAWATACFWPSPYMFY